MTLHGTTPPIPIARPTAAQIAHFVDRGYLVVPDLVTAEDIALLKLDALRIARGGYPAKSLQSLPPDTSDEAALDRLLCIHQPLYISPLMRRFVHRPAVVAVLRRIIAAHLPHWERAVKCMQSMLFVNPPGFPGQAWHRDEICIPTRERSPCGAWIAIDDATAANGCLRVLPGSQRSGYLFPARPHGQPDEFDASSESHGFDHAGVDERDEVLVEVGAASVVFCNGHQLHRSKRNRSAIHRRALVNDYMNAWSLLPWLVDRDPRFAQETNGMALADMRCVEAVSGADPYAWKGYATARDDVHLRTHGAPT